MYRGKCNSALDMISSGGYLVSMGSILDRAVSGSVRGCERWIEANPGVSISLDRSSSVRTIRALRMDE